MQAAKLEGVTLEHALGTLQLHERMAKAYRDYGVKAKAASAENAAKRLRLSIQHTWPEAVLPCQTD